MLAFAFRGVTGRRLLWVESGNGPKGGKRTFDPSPGSGAPQGPQRVVEARDARRGMWAPEFQMPLKWRESRPAPRSASGPCEGL